MCLFQEIHLGIVEVHAAHLHFVEQFHAGERYAGLDCQNDSFDRVIYRVESAGGRADDLGLTK